MCPEVALITQALICLIRTYLLCIGMTPSPGFRSVSRTCYWRRPASSSISGPCTPRLGPAVTGRHRLGWRAQWTPSRELQVCVLQGSHATVWNPPGGTNGADSLTPAEKSPAWVLCRPGPSSTNALQVS